MTSNENLPPVSPPERSHRAPRMGCIFSSMVLLGAAIAAVLWKLTALLWIAVPAGIVGGYLVVVLFNAWANSRRGDRC